MRRGGGGGKGPGQGERGRSKTRPGHRAGTGAPSALDRVRRSSQEGQEGEVHGAPAPRHHRAPARQRISASEEAPRPGVDGETWQQYGEDLEEQPPGPPRTAAARSVPGEAVASGVHPEGRRAAAAARHRRAGGQDRPARRGRGAERHLRGGLSRLLVRVPTRTQPARCAGCARGRDRTEEGELGARRRHPWFLRHHRPRMAGEVRRAPDRGHSGSCGSSRSG